MALAPRTRRGPLSLGGIWACRGLVSAGLALTASTANAEETGDVLETRVHADYEREVILRLPPVTLKAGEPRYFYGYYGAVAGESLLQGGQIRCSGNGQTFASVNTTMDHPGADGGERVVAVRWLFTPPADGAYTCAMNAFAHHRDFPDRLMTVVPGTHTRLIMSDEPSPGGMEWRQPAGERPRVDVDDPATAAREDIAEVKPLQNRERWVACVRGPSPSCG